jgi:hypothetical protein
MLSFKNKNLNLNEVEEFLITTYEELNKYNPIFPNNEMVEK